MGDGPSRERCWIDGSGPGGAVMIPTSLATASAVRP